MAILFAYRNFIKNEIAPDAPKVVSGLTQLIRMGKSIIWVNDSFLFRAGPHKVVGLWFMYWFKEVP